MGRIIFMPDPMRPEAHEQHDFNGKYIDFLEQRFPEGFGGRLSVTHKNGDLKQAEDYEFAVNDNDVVVLNFVPAGLTPIEWAYLIISVVSIAYSLSIKPPSINPDAGQAKSVYSVGVKANEASLGGAIPVGYGEFVRTPEYAAQSYRYFDADSNEVRVFQLVVGAGEYDVDEVIIGNTPASDLPSDLIQWQTYKPDQHTRKLGVISSDFGIHENVVTSGEVTGQELEIEQTSFFSIKPKIKTVTTNRIDVYSFYLKHQQPRLPAASYGSGDTLKIIGGPNAGVYTISHVDELYLTISESFPSTSTSFDSMVFSKPVNRLSPGPFVTNTSGTLATKLEFDLEFSGGLYRALDSGEFGENQAQIKFMIQKIDDAGNAVGSSFEHEEIIVAESNDPIRKTIELGVDEGRYTVTAELMTVDYVGSTDMHKVLWTGLRAFLDHEEDAPAYGETTLVAIKIVGSQAISSTSQQQIKLKARRLINGVFTSNPADIMKDIYTNPVYSAGRPVTEIDSVAFEEFRLASVNRPFNGVFDAKTTIWNALKAVALVGYAEPETVNSGLSVVLDHPKPTRSSLISPANVLKGDYKAAYTMTRDGDHDGFQIEYRNADTFGPEYVTFPEGALDPEKVSVIGIKFEDQALRMATYMWRQKIIRNMAFECRMELDPLTFNRMERVGVALPILNWGNPNQVKHADGKSIRLKKAIPAGEVFVQFRTPEGRCSDVVVANSDGKGFIILEDDEPPCELIFDGSAVSTICVTGATDELVQDILVTAIEPNGSRVRVQGKNYSDSLYIGL